VSASTKPIIAVAWPKADYVASLEQAGAVARRLDPQTDTLPGALDACDGVLLTGGPDVDPVTYGETDRHATVEVAPDRDAYELALARAALARDLPILAICRGTQVLNVAAGGSLIQDIPSQTGTALAHAEAEPADGLAHVVTVAPGTCLSLLMADQMGGQADISVNSRHHQSVKDTAPGFIVSATAPDGIIEAIERPDSRFCLGVQWHPENFWRSGRFSSLFKGLIDAARAHRRGRTYPGSGH
jgi:putative glutamine amidotransferase